MTEFLLSIATALVSTVAAADPILPPPVRYDHAHPAMTVKEVMAVDTACRATFPAFGPARGNHAILGCAEVGDGRKPCLAIVPRLHMVTPERWAAIVRHERSHCNGWPADHPR